MPKRPVNERGRRRCWADTSVDWPIDQPAIQYSIPVHCTCPLKILLFTPHTPRKAAREVRVESRLYCNRADRRPTPIDRYKASTGFQCVQVQVSDSLALDKLERYDSVPAVTCTCTCTCPSFNSDPMPNSTPIPAIHSIHKSTIPIRSFSMSLESVSRYCSEVVALVDRGEYRLPL